MTKKASAPHPGLYLKSEYLEKRLPTVSVSELAAHLQVARPNLSEVLAGRKGVGETLALRLEAAGFETAEFWLDLQTRFDLAEARKVKQPKITALLRPD